jgi:hypothetical protein
MQLLSVRKTVIERAAGATRQERGLSGKAGAVAERAHRNGEEEYHGSAELR